MFPLLYYCPFHSLQLQETPRQKRSSSWLDAVSALFLSLLTSDEHVLHHLQPAALRQDRNPYGGSSRL
ncbi:unnamed protein product [Caenorhabditis auriculariae]|uniref:Uncharacterized protein n=1 Tax=Caenorhabditis auriculariae TaxID=2777116 RepID=A0A8S1HV41_9PELO|nr:unnamed protein product [Caenorhabditis auriculariae]